MEMIYWKNKKVLVTGADGFIASHLTEKLIDCGAKISVIIRGHRWIVHRLLHKIDAFIPAVFDQLRSHCDNFMIELKLFCQH